MDLITGVALIMLNGAVMDIDIVRFDNAKTCLQVGPILSKGIREKYPTTQVKWNCLLPEKDGSVSWFRP